jgi:hypothetical protein
MTTFTLQDINTSNTNNLPTTPEEDEMFKTMAEMSKVNAFETPIFSITPQPTQMGEPLPKSQVSPEALIEDMVAQFSISLKLLLTTVINQHQPNTTPPEGDPPSLQETIALTLQQADWLKEMVFEAVEQSIDNGNFEDAVSSQVGSCVDSYFCHEFSLDDHCDVNSMVSDKVDDCLEEVVAEKLESASVSISF